MNIPNLVQEIMVKIADASRTGDVDEIARLTALAKRANDIHRTRTTLDKEFGDIEASVHDRKHSNGARYSPPPPQDSDWNTPSARHKLRVTIDWPALGFHRSVAPISNEHPTYILVDFIKELHAVLGDDALERLSKFRVSRGPLVSRNPKADYRNPKQGTLYSHHPCKGTPFYILTHSSTAEKAKNIREAAKHLGLDASNIKVELRE